MESGEFQGCFHGFGAAVTEEAILQLSWLDLGQFVGQQLLSVRCLGGILPGAKNNVLADRISLRRQFTRRFRGSRITVHTDLTEIGCVGLFHACAGTGIERLAFSAV